VVVEVVQVPLELPVVAEAMVVTAYILLSS
jgi:hypothetical protein